MESTVPRKRPIPCARVPIPPSLPIRPVHRDVTGLVAEALLLPKLALLLCERPEINRQDYEDSQLIFLK